MTDPSFGFESHPSQFMTNRSNYKWTFKFMSEHSWINSVVLSLTCCSSIASWQQNFGEIFHEKCQNFTWPPVPDDGGKYSRAATLSWPDNFGWVGLSHMPWSNSNDTCLFNFIDRTRAFFFIFFFRVKWAQGFGRVTPKSKNKNSDHTDPSFPASARTQINSLFSFRHRFQSVWDQKWVLTSATRASSSLICSFFSVLHPCFLMPRTP